MHRRQIYLAARSYARTPTVVFAGINYGAGSSRDWAAKVLNLVGIKAGVARSIERIHRSNLIGMGVLPLVFAEGASVQELALDGRERLTFLGLAQLTVGDNPITLRIERSDRSIPRACWACVSTRCKRLGTLSTAACCRL